MSWRAGLDGYNTSALDPIFRFWIGKLVGHKEARVAAVAAVLADEAKVTAAVQGWPAELRRAIVLAMANPLLDAEGFVHVLAAAGLEDSPKVADTLFARGVLFPTEPCSDPQDASRKGVELALAPGFIAKVERFSPIPAPLHAVPPARVLAVETSDGDVLASAGSEIIRLADRGKLPILVSGLPSKPALAALRKAMLPYPGVDGALVLMSAVGCGLLTAEPFSQRLATSAFARELPAELWPKALTMGLAGVDGRWIDDHRATDDGELSFWLRAEHWDEFQPTDLAAARTLLLGILGRLPNEGWYAVDAIVDDAIRLLDTVGFRRANLGHWSSARPSGPYECDKQRTVLAAVLTRTFPALGLLDVGSTVAGPISRPSRAIHGRSLDREYQNPHNRDPKKPIWTPTPSPLLVRWSEVGARILGRTSTQRVATTSVGTVHVGADFEVVAPRDGLPGKLRTALDQLAVAAPLGPHDPVRRWRIERERWTNAVQGGVDAAATLAELARLSGRPVPANVTDTLAAWTASFDRIRAWTQHDLVEWASEADRDAALASVPGVQRIGARFALVPLGRIGGTRVDAGGPPPRVIQTADDGTLRVLGGLDLLGRTLVDRIAPVGKDGTRRLDRAALAGGDVAALMAELEPRLRAPMALGFEARLRGWSGGFGAARSAPAELLQFATAADARLALALPEVKDCVVGAVGGAVVVVKPKRMAELRKALAALGIGVETGLKLG